MLFTGQDDNIDDDVKIRKGRELFGIDFGEINDALAFLIGCKDPWLRCCAIYSVTPDSPADLADKVRGARNDSNPVVREPAELVLARSTGQDSV